MAEPVFPPFRCLRSRMVLLNQDDIDTDQILPARFMTTTVRTGLGGKLFHDWRYDASGAARADQPLNTLDPTEHRILVTGRNFGSGSSREHAPWALIDYGFRVVIAPGIADIFYGNAIQNGLLPIVVPDPVRRLLVTAQNQEMTIDLPAQELRIPAAGLVHRFDLDAFARLCLLNGTDALGWLLDQTPEIEAFELAHRRV